MPAPSDCIFCRILGGQAPGSFVYRDDRCAAFMDIRPVNAGHLHRGRRHAGWPLKENCARIIRE